MVLEPTVEDTIAILRGLKERYEVHHGVKIEDPASLLLLRYRTAILQIAFCRTKQLISSMKPVP
jgi:ATP-dependent Clp protease ATP-binding subunit ClpB